MRLHECALYLRFLGESLSMKNILSFTDGIDLLSGLARLELDDCDLDNDVIISLQVLSSVRQSAV